MSYDSWKATNLNDERLGPDPAAEEDNEEPRLRLTHTTVRAPCALPSSPPVQMNRSELTDILTRFMDDDRDPRIVDGGLG